MYDIIIIGGGTAGLTAALYAQRAGKKTLVLEGKAYGGQIIYAEIIKNFPGIVEVSGRDFAKTLVSQVKSFGGETKIEKVTSIKDTGSEKIVFTDMDEEYHAKAIIIATGEDNRKLGLEREDELTGHGVSYCATCDGHFYRGKDVAVVGGGNTALFDALYLADLANKVYLIHRRDEFRAEDYLVKLAKEKGNIEFVLGHTVERIHGKDEVTAIEIASFEDNSKHSELTVKAMFVAIGHEPQNQIFSELVELEEGYIKTEDGVHTSKQGIYVAGDARKKDLKQLVTAASDGAIAATTAIQEM